MEWVTDIFYAVVLAGLPLMALTFAVIWWAISRGRLKGHSVGELQQSIKALGKKREKKVEKEMETLGMDGDPGLSDLGTGDEEKLDPVLEKWFAFGGGFYGLVALYTWIIIEWNEVWSFLSDLPRTVLSFDLGSLISLVITLFIESLMNFITAISWPIFWLREAGNPWVWIGVAYGGYWLGIKLAQHVADRNLRGVATNPAAAVTRPDEED